MKRAEIVFAAQLSEAQWQEVRLMLEPDTRVTVAGVARGRTYCWANKPG